MVSVSVYHLRSRWYKKGKLSKPDNSTWKKKKKLLLFRCTEMHKTAESSATWAREKRSNMSTSGKSVTAFKSNNEGGKRSRFLYECKRCLPWSTTPRSFLAKGSPSCQTAGRPPGRELGQSNASAGIGRQST